MTDNRKIMPNGRYTDDELQLLKVTFAENLPLVKIVRKVMLQLPISEKEEVQWHSTFKNDLLNALMRKMFLPTIDGDAPLNQIIDLWMTVNLEGKMPEEEQSLINSRALVIQYLDKMLEVMAGKEEPDKLLADFDVSKPDELKARNTIIAHTENQLREIYGLAGYTAETSAETLKRLSQNSTK